MPPSPQSRIRPNPRFPSRSRRGTSRRHPPIPYRGNTYFSTRYRCLSSRASRLLLLPECPCLRLRSSPRLYKKPLPAAARLSLVAFPSRHIPMPQHAIAACLHESIRILCARPPACAPFYRFILLTWEFRARASTPSFLEMFHPHKHTHPRMNSLFSLAPSNPSLPRRFLSIYAFVACFPTTRQFPLFIRA